LPTIDLLSDFWVTSMINLQFENIVNLTNVGYFEADARFYPTPRATAEKTELIELITGGCVLYPHLGEDIECGIGTIFWHLPGEYTIHRYKQGLPYSCIVLNFNTNKKPERIVPRYSVWDQPVEVEAFSKEMRKCFYNDQYDRKIIAKYIYSTLFWKAYHFSKTQIDFHLPLDLKKILTFINEHTKENISIEEISEAVQISTPHLHFLFKKYLNDTPHHYLVVRRMQEARNFLATTNIPIKQICTMCGFVSLENFCRKFKQYTKMTPSQYREKHTIPY